MTLEPFADSLVCYNNRNCLTWKPASKKKGDSNKVKTEKFSENCINIVEYTINAWVDLGFNVKFGC